MMFLYKSQQNIFLLMKTDQYGSSFHSIKSVSDKNSSTSPQVSPERVLGFKRINSFGNPYLEATTTIGSSKASMTTFSKQPQQDSQQYNIQSYLNRNSQRGQKKQDKNESIYSHLRHSKQEGRDRQKAMDKHLRSNDFALPCVVMYNGKAIQTICRVTASQLQFENAGCSFKLSKISKVKVLYEDYRKCIWFTCEENKGNKASEIKFKIYLENDMKDQLYILFSKVIVQKLLILSYQIDLKLADDNNVDRFILAGEILKRSQFFGNWALRKLVVTDRIQSFKGDKCTFQMKNIKQIWTRFDVHENKLVLKIRHGNEKTQLAVPLVNYTIRFCKDNWLYRIYKLVSPSLS